MLEAHVDEWIGRATIDAILDLQRRSFPYQAH